MSYSPQPIFEICRYFITDINFALLFCFVKMYSKEQHSRLGCKDAFFYNPFLLLSVHVIAAHDI
jgi:hypothetical protein